MTDTDTDTDFNPDDFKPMTSDERSISDALLDRASRLIADGRIHPTEPFPPDIIDRFPPPPADDLEIHLRGDLDAAFFPCADRTVYVNMFRAALSPVGVPWETGDERNQYFCVPVPLDESITGEQLLNMTDTEFATILNTSLDELRRIVVEAA